MENQLRDGAKLVISGAAERSPQGLQVSGRAEATTSVVRRDGATRMRVIFGGMRSVLTLKHDGTLLGSFTDTTYAEGKFGIYTPGEEGGPTQITSLDILGL